MLLAAGFLLALVAQAPAPPPPPPPPPTPVARDATPAVRMTVGTAVIAGTVLTDEATPRPLRRVTLSLNVAGGPSISRMTTTDDQGRFVFTKLGAGNYNALRATRPGYVAATYRPETRGRYWRPHRARRGTACQRDDQDDTGRGDHRHDHRREREAGGFGERPGDSRSHRQRRASADGHRLRQQRHDRRSRHLSDLRSDARRLYRQRIIVVQPDWRVGRSAASDRR